ncbi:MAG: hypothetical protein U0Y68_02440 [Blastocatellia bacterium]
MNTWEVRTESLPQSAKSISPTAPYEHQRKLREQLAIELEIYAQLEDAPFAPTLGPYEELQFLTMSVEEERQQIKNLIRVMRVCQ